MELFLINLTICHSYPTLLCQAVAEGALKDGDADGDAHSIYDIPVDSNPSALLEGETLSFDGEEADAENSVASKQCSCITAAGDNGEF